MKQLVILSGKGGTGKTTVAASLIKLSQKKAFADCDVDAPNLHLAFSQAETLQKEPFYGYKKAVRYNDICVFCGKCEEYCRFDAIQDHKVNEYDCEGCGVCEAVCPARDEEGRPAIRLEDNISGWTRTGKLNGELFSTAQLRMGNGASGKLVTHVRQNILRSITDEPLVIIDGSPGIGCPVIASVTGVDVALLVTEPTLSGLHDLSRISSTVHRFTENYEVCINKFDVNIQITEQIENYCAEHNIPVVGRIPFDPHVVKAVNSGRAVVELADSPAAKAICEIWEHLSNIYSLSV